MGLSDGEHGQPARSARCGARTGSARWRAARVADRADRDARRLHRSGSDLHRLPNQDVVYGLGFFALDEQPVVVQVPDFGDRFFVYAFYDARTDQFGHVGSPYGSPPGHYLLVGPSWDGAVPEGIVQVHRSPTTLANAIPRVFMDDTDDDRAAIQPLINQVVVYPLTRYSGEMKTKNWSDVPSFPAEANSSGKETKWVKPETFFDQLPDVLDTAPPLPGEETLYGQLRALLEAGRRDRSVRVAMDDAVAECDRGLIKDFLRWEYRQTRRPGLEPLTAQRRVGTGLLQPGRERPVEHVRQPAARDPVLLHRHRLQGTALDGSRTYQITFPAGQLPPVDGFWSLTLYAGVTSPGTDQQANWLPAPAAPFSLYLRAYAGRQAVKDGTWTPPTVTIAQE
ncbi:DUF1254 domain-containing protein [Kribbella sp. NPDC051936]|uniref:DUF1254 domain-containing protein n=1 Tax=Kribbella sp. NPDC051936 TaxID=3154946 RepID=UPI003447C18A